MLLEGVLENIFPFDTDYLFLIWNNIFIPLSYKYGVSVMVFDYKTPLWKVAPVQAKQRYSYHNGKLYEFQPDNVGGWHGYPIKGTEAPHSFLKSIRDNKSITSSEYNRLIKGK